VTLSGGGVRLILYLDTCDPAQAAGYPGIFFLGRGKPAVIASALS
jgi:hypothetical protein